VRRVGDEHASPGDSGEPQEILESECAHYNELRRYILHFLELDDTAFDRWLIRQVLRTWDRQIAFIDPIMIRGKRVLEAGCGNPRVLFQLKKMGAREAIGCDLSESFVARGLKRDRTYVYTDSPVCVPQDIRLIYGDVNGPATEGMKVDTVTCFQSLHHLGLTQFADTCTRLLEPGGYVILSDPMGNHPLRGVGDKVGRLVGLLSPTEKALSPHDVLQVFDERDFAVLQFRSLNPTLEIFFHLTELLMGNHPRAALYAKFPMAMLRPLETTLERTLLRLNYRFGWRYFLVFQKVSRP